MKKITLILLSLCVLFTTSGCTEETDSSKSSSSSSSSQSSNSSVSDDSSKPEDDSSENGSDDSSKVDDSSENDSSEPEKPQDSSEDDSSQPEVPSDEKPMLLTLDRKDLYEYKWMEDDTLTLVECDFSALLLCEDDAKRYPELAQLLKDNAAAQEGYIKGEHDMLAELADEMYSYNPEGFMPLVSKRDVQVRRADSTVLSYLVDSYYYNGIFESRDFSGVNYDTKTAKMLSFPDVVTDIEGFAKVAQDKLFDSVGKGVFASENAVTDYFEMYSHDYVCWNVDYNGVTVYFTAGELASEEVGAFNVTVTFDEHPEFFNKKYMSVPDSYIVSMPMKFGFSSDLNGDGKCEAISVYDSYNYENEYNAKAEIFVNDASCSEDFWGYGVEPYYVKAPNGKHYIYLFTELETQFYLYVYEISDTGITKVGEENVSPYYHDGMFSIPTDPDLMCFNIYVDSELPDGYTYFCVGEDGLPKRQ